jgi:hypothetical protein
MDFALSLSDELVYVINTTDFLSNSPAFLSVRNSPSLLSPPHAIQSRIWMIDRLLYKDYETLKV